MSRAYKCDRCGKFYEENIVSHENERRYLVTKNVKGDGMIRERDFDLCGDCQIELEIFLGKKEQCTITDIKNLLSKEGEEHE